jgi:ribosomal protein S18 acetylase RimI-like enzyme
MNPFTINLATNADVPLILELIRELAEFEQLAHELEVSADSLREALFGKDPVAHALIARMSGGETAGYAVFYRTFSTFVGRPGIFLDDLYVRPQCRKLGIGRALLTRVARIGMEQGGGRFEWITLRWNENAFRFYRSIGASVMNEWALLRMNGNEVRNLVGGRVKVAA